MDLRLGTLLVKRKIITAQQLQTALQQQEDQPGGHLGDILVEKGWCSCEDLDAALQTQSYFNLPSADDAVKAIKAAREAVQAHRRTTTKKLKVVTIVD